MAKPREADAVVWRGRFLTLLDRSPTPTAIAGTNGLVSVANPAFAGALGLQPGRVANRLLLDLLTPTNSAQLRKLDEAMRSGRRSRYPVEACWTAGGALRHGQVTVEPVTDPLEDTPPLIVTLRVAEAREEASGNRAADRTGRPGGAGDDAEEELAHPALSAQEARILRLVAGGATTAVVARTIGIGTDGVNYHLTRLCRRLRVPNRTALVARAYVLGLLAPEAWPPQVSGPAGRRGGPTRGGA
ncbi:helix-turn-helix transcriptional regulator [Streptomyces venezuelae]|uniref:Diguanylate cyclase n=1 Tax=Streptomyces venezuelae TaxID=54571 RepID=A0A5P2C7X3_STRVZ|nr:LuxR C-terminal-related transcriptional regulator [Streptomyces venezuelae]QES38762.1 diguanylate cyclase [Streptomyces venezuelae]